MLSVLNIAVYTIKITTKHDDRLTVLSKFNNTNTYNTISDPTSLEHVKLFELNNELCISIDTINGNHDIITYQLGNLKSCQTIVCILSVIYDAEHIKSHSLYISNTLKDY